MRVGWDGTEELGEKPLDEKEPVPGSAPVEAEDELVEVALQVTACDGAVQRSEKPPVEEREDAVDSGEELGGLLRVPDHDHNPVTLM